MPRVFIPNMLRDLTAGVAQVDIDAANIGRVIAALDERFPGVAARLLRAGTLAPGIAVSVDGALSPRGLVTAVGPASEVHFLPAIGGG